MQPKLVVKSGKDKVLRSLVSCISGIECKKFISSHLGRPQPDKRQIVADSQKVAMSMLEGAMPQVIWSTEERLSENRRDSVDVFGKGNAFVVVIELDATRADQVAKKFVSRMALLPSKKVYFISLCYPGTRNMNRPECEKYFDYCSALSRRMGCHYAGFIIG